MVTKKKPTALSKAPTVGKTKIAERVYNSTGKKHLLTKNQVETVISEFLEEIKNSLIKGEEIRFPNYFSLKTTIQKPRTAMNLQTKKKMNIPAKRVPKAKFSEDLKEMIKKGK